MPDLSPLASHGVLGVLCAVFIVLWLRKDKELAECNAARVAEANAGRDLALGITNKTNDAIVTLRAVLEEQRKGRQG